jgi:uncharacterized protein (TIGR02246 family)
VTRSHRVRLVTVSDAFVPDRALPSSNTASIGPMDSGMAAMSDDEALIKQLLLQWQTATRDGDTDTVLSLMTNDVVFQVPGRPPFGRKEFEAVSRTPRGAALERLDFEQHFDELVVSGNFAYVRTTLRIAATPRFGSPYERSGTTLSIFRKDSGNWLLARDANLLATTLS